MAELSEKEKDFLKNLLDAEILKPKDLGGALAGKGGFSSVLEFLGRCVDEEALVFFGLRLNPEFVYIRDIGAAFGALPGQCPGNFLRHGAVPLGAVGKTHWVGVVRTFPFDAVEIAGLLDGKQAAFAVLTFNEYIECEKKLKK